MSEHEPQPDPCAEVIAELEAARAELQTAISELAVVTADCDLYVLEKEAREAEEAKSLGGKVVVAPTQFPNCCLFCQSQRGPIWFGGMIMAQELGGYVCRTCAEGMSVEYGIAEGPEMDRLRDAAAELAQKEKEAEAHAAQQADSARIISGLRGELRVAKEQLEAERGKVATMEHAAQDVREAVGTFAGATSAVEGHFHDRPDPED